MTVDEIIAEIDRRRLDGMPFDGLLAGAVERLHMSSDRFAWTGIYEVFPDGVLRLGPFVGAPTEHVFIGVGRGACGTSVAEKRNLNLADATRIEDDLLSARTTRSQLVVLIRRDDRVYAGIDIESDRPAAFDDRDERDVERLADALAELYALREEHAATERMLA